MRDECSEISAEQAFTGSSLLYLSALQRTAAGYRPFSTIWVVARLLISDSNYRGQSQILGECVRFLAWYFLRLWDTIDKSSSISDNSFEELGDTAIP